MTDKKDEVEIINKIVVTMDICSSSLIIEDLIKTTNIKLWRDLLIQMKEYLVNNSSGCGADIHKFIGDGWIILFDKPYSAPKIFQFISGINQEFGKWYTQTIFPNLDTPPDISGLTFGIDEGQLIQITMNDREEYIGRPINIACRLQGAINEIDMKGGFNIFMSHRLFNYLKMDSLDYFYEVTERPLRNISEGKNFRCYRISTSNNLKIITAIYGSPNNSIDITYQCTKQIKDNKIDVVVSNELAESDPDYGAIKTLSIRYIYQGKEYKKDFKEWSRMQIP
jgi:hypothetical protein